MKLCVNNMQDLSDKLRLIYKPIVLITIGFILTYTFLHWALFIKAGISTLKEGIVNYWLPLGLSWIPILIWLRPRIKLLNYNDGNNILKYQFLINIAIVLPTAFAQQYLITATSKLTQLDNITQISQHDKTKYYSLKNCYIDKLHIAVQNTFFVSGKFNDEYNMYIYIAMPILENDTDTVKADNKYWLGKIYHEQISNMRSDEEKNDEFKVFAAKTEKEFDETDFSKFTYLEVVGDTEDHDEFNNALKNFGQSSTGDNIVFEAKTTPFEARNGNKLLLFFGTLGIGLLVNLLPLLSPKLQISELEKSKNGKIKNNDTQQA